MFNLAFGDKNSFAGGINDLAVTNNDYTERVLRTVADSIDIFLSRYPEAYVYATGSTLSRTILYRMGITKFYEEIKNDFYFYGQVGLDFFRFETGRSMTDF